MTSQKLGTDVKVAQGGKPYAIDPKKTERYDASDVMLGEDIIRNTAVEGGSVSALRVQLDSIVAPGAVDRVMSALREMKLDPEIVGCHGRIVMFRDRRGVLPPWHEFCEVLLGGEIAQDFDVKRPPGKKLDVLYVKLLSAAQSEALAATEELDNLFNAQIPRFDNRASHFVTCRSRIAELSGESDATPGIPRPARKKKIPEGAATFVMKVMERDAPVGDIELATLVEKTAKTMPPKLDAEGVDRSKRYIRAAVEKLVALELLHLHEGAKVSLSALVQSDDAGF